MSKNNRKQKRPFSLLVKPASADCNLHCDYCFYLEKHNLYPGQPKHRMSDAVLEQFISSYMKTPQPVYSFGWQGGEPTLMGTEFFKKVTSLQQRYGSKGTVVANGVQTNATLIDDEMAEHFAQYKFLVGVSLDGPAEVHDVYRKTRTGKPSHSAVIEGIETLRRHEVAFNTLTLVSSANVEYPEKVYRYLVDNGFYFHQYIPCVEFDEEGNPLPWTITGEQWGRFLSTLFDIWVEEHTEQVSVRYFDALLEYMVHNRQVMCTLGRNCRQYFVVEHNGDIYPCDFFVEKDKLLGNVFTDSWTKLANSPVYKTFGRMKSRWNEKCVHCPYLKYCAGDCLKHRLYNSGDPRTLSWLCRGREMFFEHALPRLHQLADYIKVREQHGGQPHGHSTRIT
jgi:uncharacterized protein